MCGSADGEDDHALAGREGDRLRIVAAGLVAPVGAQAREGHVAVTVRGSALACAGHRHAGAHRTVSKLNLDRDRGVVRHCRKLLVNIHPLASPDHRKNGVFYHFLGTLSSEKIHYLAKISQKINKYTWIPASLFTF